MSKSKTSTDVLQEAFPGRVSISPKEAATAIHGSGRATKKRIEAVRNALDRGMLIPGLRKTGKRWSIPIAALGRALDSKSRQIESDSDITPIRRSKHSTIGPHMFFGIQKTRDALQSIIEAFEKIEADNQLNTLANLTPMPAGAKTVIRPLGEPDDRSKRRV